MSKNVHTHASGILIPPCASGNAPNRRSVPPGYCLFRLPSIVIFQGEGRLTRAVPLLAITRVHFKIHA